MGCCFLFDKGNIEKLVDTRNVIVVDVTSPTIGTDEIEVDDPH